MRVGASRVIPERILPKHHLKSGVCAEYTLPLFISLLKMKGLGISRTLPKRSVLSR